MNHTIAGAVLAATLSASPALAQSTSGTWNDLPDRFQLDVGYFRIEANTLLRYQGLSGTGGEIDFENDLGVSPNADTFWIDGTWRVGRRHQVKLAFTRLSRDRPGYTLQRNFTWGGQQYTAGLTANTETGANIWGGYYRFAAVRKDRFEIGPAIGIGHLKITAGIQATGTGTGGRTLDQSASTGNITGAVGGYASGWPARRLSLTGDFLYIKVNPGNSEASVTDWRLGANYYFFRTAGLGVQYKYGRYKYDRGILTAELGGEVTYEGLQAFVTFRF
jgi:hypothetical protein